MSCTMTGQISMIKAFKSGLCLLKFCIANSQWREVEKREEQADRQHKM